MQLRPYQIAAANSASSLLSDGIDPLIVHATGAGKTVTMSEMVRRELADGGNVLVLAHRVELLTQITNALSRIGISSIRDLEEWGSSRVVVTSPASARRHLRMVPVNAFTLVIVDEAHHAVAGGHRLVIDHFRDRTSDTWQGARVLGFTATTDRLDGVGLHNVFDEVAHTFNIEQAIAAGFLVPARAIRVDVEGMDLSSVRQVTRRGAPTSLPLRDDGARDLHPGDLGRAVLADNAISGVVDPLLELAGWLRTVVFAVNVAHMKALCDALRMRGATARWVDGSLSKKARAGILADHKAGKFQFLVNILVLTEGYDDPGIECVAMVRPTQSRILFAQACGRGLRTILENGIPNFDLKSDCLILDFCGVSSQFTLVGPEVGLKGGLVGPIKYYNAATRTTSYTPVVKVGPARKHRWWKRLVNLFRGK